MTTQTYHEFTDIRDRTHSSRLRHFGNENKQKNTVDSVAFEMDSSTRHLQVFCKCVSSDMLVGINGS